MPAVSARVELDTPHVREDDDTNVDEHLESCGHRKTVALDVLALVEVVRVLG